MSTLARIADALEADHTVDHMVMDLTAVPAAVLAKPVSEWTDAELGLVGFPSGHVGDVMRRVIATAAGAAVPIAVDAAMAAAEGALR